MPIFNSNSSDQNNFWVATLKVNVNVDLNFGSKKSENQVTEKNSPKTQSCVQRIIVCLLFPCEITYFLVYTVFLRFLNIFKYFFPGKPKSLKNEIILVSGGGSGIGREICHQIAKQEKNLAIVTWDEDEKNNLETLELLKNLGVRRAFASTVDVSDREQVAAAAEKVRENIGDVTILFNNTGIQSELQNRNYGWKQDPGIIENVFASNVLSHCWTLQEFLPRMIEMGSGHVVETCSVLGFLPVNGSAEYVGSKFALRGYFQRIKDELKRLPQKHDVCISLVYPNFSSTSRNSEAKSIIGLARYFFFNRTITARSIASKIVYGVRRRKEHIYIPEESRFLHILADFFPEEVIGKILDFAGLPDLDDPES